MSEYSASALREKMKAKAHDMSGGSDSKGSDVSDWSLPKSLNAETKTGMKPLGKQHLATGGSVGLANTDQKVANKERPGKEHEGGMKSGGMAKRASGGRAGDDDYDADAAWIQNKKDDKVDMVKLRAKMQKNHDKYKDPKIKAFHANKMKLIDDDRDGKAKGGEVDTTGEADGLPDSDGKSLAEKAPPRRPANLGKGSDLAPKTSIRPKERPEDITGEADGFKKGGMAKHGKDCDCNDCCPKMERKNGGRTNINIIIAPNKGGQPEPMKPPMMPPMMSPMMPPPGGGGPALPGGLPAGAGLASASAGPSPMPHPMPPPTVPPGMPPGMPGRKDGGRLMKAEGGGTMQKGNTNVQTMDVPLITEGTIDSDKPLRRAGTIKSDSGLPGLNKRKEGGRVGALKMEHGAGGGLGRLEKIRKYGDKA